MRRFLFALLLSFFTDSILLGQEVDTVWVRRYNGPSNLSDYPRAIASDDSGNAYVTGQSFSYNTGYDYATLKYYPDGDTAWMRRYNGTGNKDDGAIALALDRTGDLYVTGWSVGTANYYDFGYATIKYRQNGDTAWVRRYEGPVQGLDDAATGLTIDSSGNIYVTGHSWDTGTCDDYATFKYSADGDLVWLKRYSGAGCNYDQPNALGVDGTGHLYVTGLSFNDQTGSDYLTIKYQPDGDTAWVRKYDGQGSSDDDASAMVIDGSGNVYVTGAGYNSFTDFDYTTIKYYPNGDTAWVRSYNGPGNSEDRATALALDRERNLYVTGYSYSSQTDFDYATLKYDSSGNLLWVTRYNGPGNGNDQATALSLDDSGNVYVTGGSSGIGTNLDFATLKYDPSGNLRWVKRYNGRGNGNDIAVALTVDRSGGIILTGQSYEKETKDDYVTIKYSQLLFYRGDANQDKKVTISDIVYLISYLFKGGPPPYPFASGDCNCDGTVTISDVIFLVSYLFKGGPKPEC
ncbi:MAG: SBBP repeat-containing protein [candidate division Zixibacteria bacterium]|nr:SBBP repeat-containing protein [candidate division Zixibacteria bacterium]